MTIKWYAKWWRALQGSISVIAALIALIATIMAYRSSEDGVRAQYVALAITILREPSKGGLNDKLHDWAVTVFRTYSPLPLPSEVVDGLRGNAITLSSASGALSTGAASEPPK